PLDLTAVFEDLPVEGRQRVLAEVIGMQVEERIALPGFVLAVFGIVGLEIVGIDAAVAHWCPVPLHDQRLVRHDTPPVRETRRETVIYHATAQGPMPRGLRPLPPILDGAARAWRSGADLGGPTRDRPAPHLLQLTLHHHRAAGAAHIALRGRLAAPVDKRQQTLQAFEPPSRTS